MTKHSIVEVIYLHILLKIPDILWIRIIHVDGLACSHYDYNSESVKNEPDILDNEDLYAPMSAATLSLSERITSEMKLGVFRLTIIAGKDATHFFVPIGTGEKWFLSFAVAGHPSIDNIIAYFENRNFLAEIEPDLKTK